MASKLAVICYGFGDLASQFVWTFVGSYLTIYYTDIVGLAPAIVSVIMMGARIWDAINDPMMGAIAERTRSKFGRFRPYIAFGCPFLAIFAVLTFTNPFGGGSAAGAIWVAVTYIIAGMLHTLVNIPYAARSGVMTEDANQRNKINTSRNIGMNLGLVIVNALSAGLALRFSSEGAEVRKRPRLHDDRADLRNHFHPAVPDRIRNGQGEGAAHARHTGLLVQGYGQQSGTQQVPYDYYPHHVASDDRFHGQNRGYQLLRHLLPGLVHHDRAHYDHPVPRRYHRFVLSFRSLQSVSVSAPYSWVPCSFRRLVCWSIDFAPLDNITMVLAGCRIFGLFNVGFPMTLSMVADSVDYMELKTGIRTDGTAYATYGLATKVGNAIGGSIGVLLLAAFGYVANAEQTVEVMNGINIVVNLIPAILFILGAAACLLWDMSDCLLSTLELDIAECDHLALVCLRLECREMLLICNTAAADDCYL